MPWIASASTPNRGARAANDAAPRSDAEMAAAIQGAQLHIARLVQRLLGWPCAAEVDDAVQDALLRAWSKRRQFRGDAHFRTWLSRIAVHSARTHQRTLFRRLRRRDAEPVESLSEDLGTIEARDRNAALRRAIQDLPHKHREILVLHYLDGRSIAETAELLGLKRNTTDARLTRARGRLEGLLRERGWEAGDRGAL